MQKKIKMEKLKKIKNVLLALKYYQRQHDKINTYPQIN